jgi:hypothetical protein
MIASRCGHVIVCTRRRLDPHPILRHAGAGHGARRWLYPDQGTPLPQGRVVAGGAGEFNWVAARDVIRRHHRQTEKGAPQSNYYIATFAAERSAASLPTTLPAMPV